MKNPLNLQKRENRLTSFSPFFDDFNRMRRQMDRLFEDFNDWNEAFPMTWNDFMPSCDLDETDSHYLLSFDLPGLKKEDIHIEARNQTLLVSGERKEETEEKKKNRYRSERSYGSFSRSFTLPEPIKNDQIEANYENGVLTVAVPKSEASKAKSIPISENKSGFLSRFLGTKKSGAKSSERREVA